MEHRKDLFNYGYKWLGMQEIPYEIALKIANDKAVYLLYEDNTESLAESFDDIKCHYEKGGKFGIELNDFDNYVVFILGRDLLKDFEISEYNRNTKGLYECLEEYIADFKKYFNSIGIMTFMEVDMSNYLSGRVN